MHRSILKSAHSMDAERWVNAKHGSFTTNEWTEFGKQVGMTILDRWYCIRLLFTYGIAGRAVVAGPDLRLAAVGLRLNLIEEKSNERPGLLAALR